MEQAQRRLPAGLDIACVGAALACALLIGLASPLVAAGLLLGAACLLGALINPVVGLYLAVGSVMVQDLVPLPLGLTVTHVMGALALGAWLLHGAAEREIRLERHLLLAWVVFLAALFLSAGLTQYNAVDALKQCVRWVVAFLGYIIAVATVRTPRAAAGLIAVILVAGLLEGLLGLWQFVTAAGPFGLGDVVRAYGTIGKPNTYAGFLGMIWPLGLAVGLGLLWAWWRERAAWQLASGVAALGMGGIALLGVGVSFSRGAWLGAIAAIAVMLALAGRRRAVPYLVAGALLGAVVVVAPNLLPGAIAERAQSITENLRIFDASRVTVTDENFAVVERMAHWQAGYLMAADHPFLGVGPDNFNKAYPDYFVGRWSISQGHAHNYYIHIAAEGGLLGLVAYLVLIGAVVVTGWRALEATRGTPWHAAAIGGCGIIAAVQVHNVFENLHVLNFGLHLSAVWALLTRMMQTRGWRT